MSLDERIPRLLESRHFSFALPVPLLYAIALFYEGRGLFVFFIIIAFVGSLLLAKLTGFLQSRNPKWSVLPTAVGIIVLQVIIALWVGLGIMGGASPLLLPISLVVSAVSAVGVPLLLKRFPRWQRLSFFLAFVLAVALTFISNIILITNDDQRRTNPPAPSIGDQRIAQARTVVPIFPGARFKEATYEQVGDKPFVLLTFELPAARERYCEVVAHFDQQLRASGWYNDDGPLPQQQEGSTCPINNVFTDRKISPDRFIVVTEARFEQSSFQIKMGF